MNDSPFAILESLCPEEIEAPQEINDTWTVEAFDHWLKTAKPRSEIVYAVGVWLEERKLNNSKVYILSEETRAVAKAAYQAYKDGKVELAQRGLVQRGNLSM